VASWRRGGVEAVTLWPCILYRPVEPSASLRAHEWYHWRDALRWGVVAWYIVYLVLLVFYGGGRKHPLETQAWLAGEREESA
jgi:hypothetical protein